MTEASAQRELETPLDLDALFEVLPFACAALAPGLRILRANRAFPALCPTPTPTAGKHISELLRIDDSLFPSTREQSLRGRLHTGESILLRLAPGPRGYVAVVQPVAREESEERVLLVLSRDTIASTTEEEVVAALEPSRSLEALQTETPC